MNRKAIFLSLLLAVFLQTNRLADATIDTIISHFKNVIYTELWPESSGADIMNQLNNMREILGDTTKLTWLPPNFPLKPTIPSIDGNLMKGGSSEANTNEGPVYASQFANAILHLNSEPKQSE